MNSLKILRTAVRLLVNESIREGNLDASWSTSPLAAVKPEDEKIDDDLEENDLEEFGGGYGRPCGC